MSTRTGRFSRSDRLLQSRDYKRVAAKGERSSCREFVVLVAPGTQTSSGRTRLGITASRRVGNAVVRNRVKRAIREWFRASRSQIGSDLDVVVIARAAASELSSRELVLRLCTVLNRFQERTT